MRVVHQENAAAEACQHLLHGLAVERAATRRRALQPIQHARLVALRLQTADEPRARIGQSLVVEVNRILGGEHHA